MRNKAPGDHQHQLHRQSNKAGDEVGEAVIQEPYNDEHHRVRKQHGKALAVSDLRDPVYRDHKGVVHPCKSYVERNKKRDDQPVALVEVRSHYGIRKIAVPAKRKGDRSKDYRH